MDVVVVGLPKTLGIFLQLTGNIPILQDNLTMVKAVSYYLYPHSTKSQLNCHNMTYNIYLSFEELLSRSTAQVIFNVTHIVYVLKIPQLSQNIYEYDYIDSTIKNQKRIMIVQNVLLKNDTHVFELTQPYVEQSDYYLCDITSLSITIDCIQQLIRGQHSNCNFEKENKRWNYIYKRRISRYNFKLQ